MIQARQLMDEPLRQVAEPLAATGSANEKIWGKVHDFFANLASCAHPIEKVKGRFQCSSATGLIATCFTHAQTVVFEHVLPF